MCNSSVLQMPADVTDEQLEFLKEDPSTALLEGREKRLLLFVLKAVETRHRSGAPGLQSGDSGKRHGMLWSVSARIPIALTWSSWT